MREWITASSQGGFMGVIDVSLGGAGSLKAARNVSLFVQINSGTLPGPRPGGGSLTTALVVLRAAGCL